MPLTHKTTTVLKWLRSLLTLTIGLIALGSTTAFVIVDCRPQSGEPAHQTLCKSIFGGVGNNPISVDQVQTVTGPFFGDGVMGNGGNDTLINNGTTVSSDGGTGRNGDIEGDVATGNGGDDVIVNNGSVAGDIDGDTALGNGGNDVLINNGSVDDDMDGDNARKNGGDDLIINNGTVGGDIQADDNEDTAGSIGGKDIIVINGTVEGLVDGDTGVKTGGDDLVILQSGASGGADHILYINGNDGSDTLVFNFTVFDQAADVKLSAQIAAANPTRGSLTVEGQTFEWENFEHLDNAVMIQGMTDAFVVASDNQTRAAIYLTSASVYCAGGSLTAVGLDIPNRVEWLFTIKGADLKAALAQAASAKSTVTIAQADGQTLSALSGAELGLTDASGRYAFIFAGDMCAG